MKKQAVTQKIRFAVVMLMALLLSACAGMQKAEGDAYGAPTQEIADPLEPVNRAVFSFNNFLDRALIEPVAKLYTVAVPQPVRNSVQNFMRNLKTPLVAANDLLQGDFGDVGVDLARFAINTTVGVGGLFDVAATQGLTYEKEDFGQTLASWGFGDGFYLVLPVIGPSSLRDGVGLAVDTLADPVRIYAHNQDKEWIYYTRNAVEGLDDRSRVIYAIDDLRRYSLDYYASVRSIYAQKRQAQILDQSYSDGYVIPDYDDNY